MASEAPCEVDRLDSALQEIAQSMGKRFVMDPARSTLFAARRADHLYGALEVQRSSAKPYGPEPTRGQAHISKMKTPRKAKRLFCAR
jgi:hypothetical protein